jgi:prevent-host-death family protein
MHISVSDAKAQLTELVRRAEAGEEVVLTRHGHPTVRLAPVGQRALSPAQCQKRDTFVPALRGSGKNEFGPDAARATDFLYDDAGLPR